MPVQNLIYQPIYFGNLKKKTYLFWKLKKKKLCIQYFHNKSYHIAGCYKSLLMSKKVISIVSLNYS